MIAASAIGVLALMLSVGLFAMLPSVFDSGESAAAWGIFVFVWSMPLVLIGGLVLGWVGFARNSQGMVVAGLLVAGLPLAVAAGVIAMAG